jgi:transposase
LQQNLAEDLRRNALKLAAEGLTRKAIASQLGIGEATVYRILATQKSLTA